MNSFTSEQMERYSRHFVLKEIGFDGQKRLLESKILVIGAGALGSAALMYLSAAGVGTIGIADYDRVEISNLQRQIIHSADSVGKNKTESAKSAVEAVNPSVCVIVHNERITADNVCKIIRGYDFIIDGSDSFGTKFLINDACVLERKPYSHAGAVMFGGQTLTYVPGKGPCLRCLIGEVPASDSSCSCAQSGVIGAVTGVIGSIQALEAVKYITGAGNLLTGRIFSFDGLKMKVRVTDAPAALTSCRVCGENPSITSVWENRKEYEAGEVCPLSGGDEDICIYATKRADGDLLIDLRDKISFRHGSLPGAVNIPSEEIQRLYALPKDKKIYLFCQSGDASRKIARLLREAGHEAYDLKGGYLRYLKEVFDNYEVDPKTQSGNL